MARDVEALVLLMDANINKFTRKLEEAHAKFDKAANSIERRQREMDKRLAQLGAKAGDLYRPVQVGAALATGAIVALSYEAAKRAQDVNGAFAQTFRDMPKEAEEATTAIADEFKRLETDIKDNFTQAQAVMIGLGVNAQQSLGIVDQLQRRALDMAAFKPGTTDAQAFQAVISGITGETEPLKRFGIVVNETATKAELLRLGFKGNAEQAPEAAKAIARANLILAKSATMHGQVAREAGNAANKEKELRAQFIGAAEDFGQQFLPVAAEVLKWASDALKAFNDLDGGTKNAALGLLALVAVGGPILSVIKGLKDLITTAVAARAAMLALGGTSAAAGGAAAGGAAAGGAAAGGFAGRLVAGAARAAGPVGAALLVSGDTPQANGDLQDRINNQLREEARLTGVIARLRAQGNEDEARRQEAYQQRVRSSRELAQGLQEIARPRTPQETADQQARDALAQIGNFQLSGDQLKPVAGGDGSGDASARAAQAAAERLAERREALALERAIDLARASGDDKSIRAAEERQRLAQLTAQYEDAGYADAQAQALEHLSLLNAAEQRAEERAKAEEQVDLILEGRRRQLEREADYQQLLNDQLMDRLAMEAQLASLRGDRRATEAAERELWIAERINELLRLRPELNAAAARGVAEGEVQAIDDATTQGRFRDLVVEAGRDFGSLTERAGDAFKQKALEGLADGLFSLINAAFGGRGAGVVKSLLDYLPGFDSGGYTGPGPRLQPAGVVHAGEVVWSQRDVARHGGPAVVEALRRGLKGYADGGVVAAPALNAVNRAMDSANRVRSAFGVGALSVSVDVSGANGDTAVAAIAEAAARRGTEAAIAQSRADQAQANAARRYRLK
ncbi:hypothetical protein [Brevundimonas aurantiaca]|uniref:hypothetical protein n=1 Tax=Brevundimonas aurantiaca TaxID=74316 RepID=UPI0030161D08